MNEVTKTNESSSDLPGFDWQPNYAQVDGMRMHEDAGPELAQRIANWMTQ